MTVREEITNAFAHPSLHGGLQVEAALTVYSTTHQFTPGHRRPVLCHVGRAYPIVYDHLVARLIGGTPLRRHLRTHDTKYREMILTCGHEFNKKQMYLPYSTAHVSKALARPAASGAKSSSPSRTSSSRISRATRSTFPGQASLQASTPRGRISPFRPGLQ